MYAKFRQYHTILEIRGDKDSESDKRGLKDLAYAYIQSANEEELKNSRTVLYNRLKKGAKEYIENTWRHKESRVVRCYTRLNFNLDCHSSQRSESYHVVLKQMTNGQLSLENSAKMLAQTVIRLIRDMEQERDDDLKAYFRRAQSSAFKNLRMNITNFALTRIALEWDNLCLLAPSEPLEMSECTCSILLQFGLPCKHYLLHFYLTGGLIPRSLCHPRWWRNGGPIKTLDWKPSLDSLYIPPSRPQPLFTAAERRILELREELDRENLH